MKINIKERIKELYSRSKSNYLRMDEAIILEMDNTFINIKKALITFTKDNDIKNFENTVYEELEGIYNKSIDIITYEDVENVILEKHECRDIVFESEWEK